MLRDVAKEFQDNEQRKYAYDFDFRMHGFMWRTMHPFLRPGRALELGCFKGDFTKTLLKHFESVVVVEGAQELIDEAKKNAPAATYVQGLFENVSLDGSFDSIFLTHTLEHLDDPHFILTKYAKYLSDQGVFFIVVPNAYALSRQIAVAMGLIAEPTAVTEGEYLHGHRRTYSLETLRREVTLAGLTPIHMGGITVKPLANFQLDRALQSTIISDEFLEGCYQLGMKYPELCSSIFAFCKRTPSPTS